MATPILRWAGGKRAMLDDIMPHLPSKSDFGCYFEPFFGGGAVFFNLEPSNGIINDINPKLINFYRQVKQNPEQIIQQNRLYDDEYESRCEDDQEDYYYDKREEFNDLCNPSGESNDPIEEASLLLFLNRTCFNGLYRTNNDGNFNVPIGRNWTGINVIEPRVRTGHRILQRTEIHCRDFTEIVEIVSEDDLVFFDPPYPSVRKTGSFEKYHPEGFGFERHKELQQLAFELDRRGAYVIITNANDSNGDLEKEDYVDVLYDEDAMPESFRRIQTEGKRMINSDSTERTGIGKTDIIVTNYSKFDPQMSFDDFRN